MQLIKTLNLLGFPQDSKTDTFHKKHPVGPNFAFDLAQNLMSKDGKAECVDFDTDSSYSISETKEIFEGGDLLYVIYQDQKDWIYIFSSDLNWGIVFSNVDLKKSDLFHNLDLASKDFLESYRRRTTIESPYYDGQALSNWARAAGLGSSELGLR